MAKELPNRRWLVGSLFSPLILLTLLGVLAPGMSSSQNRTLSFECVDSGALRVTCESNFVDGSSAAGITVRVFDKSDHVVYVGTVDRYGRFSFRKPDAEFHIEFDAGHGSLVTVLAPDIS